MTRVSRGLAVLLSLSALASCDELKKKLGKGGDADASADASSASAEVPDSAPPPAAGPTAANVDDIARFTDEKKLDAPGVAAIVQRPSNVREVPAVGKVVAALPKGTSVTQWSLRDKYIVVTFDDPKTPGRKLMGWVTQDAFSAALVADAGVKPLTCTAPELALISDAPFCGRICSKDGECPAGQACSGSAAKLKNGKAGDSVTVCAQIVVHDAGAPVTPPAAAPDAGASVGPGPNVVVLLDAGAAKPADAGAPATPASTDPDLADPVAGKCAADFFLVPKDKKCHRLCPTFKECKVQSHSCVGCGTGVKVCSAVRGLCQ
jgi:hypothetical protein